MLRWLAPRKVREATISQHHDEVTDDPLAAIDFDERNKQIYSVSRSVYLPRVVLKNGHAGGTVPFKGEINPLYKEENKCTSQECPSHSQKCSKTPRSSRHSTPVSGEKSSSSGYGGSGGSINYNNSDVKLRDDAIPILEQNGNYVRSIKGSSNEKNKKKTKTDSSAGTLTTIPEGKVDFTIPRPIWPRLDKCLSDSKKLELYDCLVDEAVLLYANSEKTPNEEKSIRDILVELLNNINATIEGKGIAAEDMLKCVNEKIALSIEALKNSTEEEMRKLCVNMSNSKNVSSVIRAFSNSSGTNSTSGNSSESSPEWSSGSRVRTTSSETEDLYQIPSGSSSSGFSDSVKQFDISQLPVFVHENLSSVPNGVRNAMIYGTLCRTNFKSGTDRLIEKDKSAVRPKKSLLLAVNDNKPSVWEQYYGVNAAADAVEITGYIPKPTDIPIFPGGRPEADFTLDVHRSEILTKRLKADKKWRCRCRIVTSILGLLFFLASVMAVSLVLTRGKRMFGSMV